MVFVSKHIMKIELKDPILYLEKSCIVYRFNCFCDRSYIGQTLSLKKPGIKEHVPKSMKIFIDVKKTFKQQ